ncbi:MAG TPA: quinol:electron acceptor oxidoreductase subunit ActD [Candidatus Binataceae bacterium]|nr:quinol:electron acceptor oxidoreductase subunit ActD [Candidatus Binataceae bacterium]
MSKIKEPPENGRNDSVNGWLGGLVIAGALAAAWRLQRRLHYRKHEAMAPQRETPLVGANITEGLAQASVVVGSFDDADGAIEAARALRVEWPYGFRAYSPNLNEAFFEAMELPQSVTRLWIAAGAIVGELGGWATTIMLSIYWPHPVAGMPVISIPPFTIISFEMMVLFGVGGGLLGLLFHCGLPSLQSPPEYLQRFQRDRFGIVLNCEGAEQALRARRLLDQHGAKNIQYA